MGPVTLNSQLSTLNLLLAALASAALLVLSFPRFGLFPLAWVALVPWLVVLPRMTFRQAAFGSLLLGCSFFAGLCYWLVLYGLLPWVLLSLFQGLFVTAACLGAWLYRGAHPAWRVLGTAGIWTVFEWLRGLGPSGFTWGWLGYSQAPWLGIIQIASVAGVPAISFLIVLHNAVLAEAWKVYARRKLLPNGELTEVVRSVGKELAPATRTKGSQLPVLFTPWIIVATLAFWGHYVVLHPATPHRTVRLAVLQLMVRTPSKADITRVWTDENTRLDRKVFATLVERAAETRPQIIIAPESALPGLMNRTPALMSAAQDAALASGAWMLVGSHAEDENQAWYNSAYLLSPQGELHDRYDKVQLVPFGEFVPGRTWLPGLKQYPISVGDLSPGRAVRPLQAGPQTLGIAICFESIFPAISRRLVEQGAGILAVITNDGWFYRTAAAAQHEQIAVFRAVETRRWIARSALTGISCLISPQGRITQELPLYQRGILTATVGVGEEKTLYVRYGDWFVVVAGFLVGIAFVNAVKKMSWHVIQ